jgi:hypothetical protein
LSRYAVVLEAMISPEGTFPAIGRSMTYRTGSFHALAYAAWKGLLPPSLPPAAVRGALDAVTKRVFSAPDTFDSRGWLRAGLAGFQPGLAEHYISTGSLYLCTCGFLALGLPADAAFWADPDLEWSSRRIWGGGDSCADHALKPEVRWIT